MQKDATVPTGIIISAGGFIKKRIKKREYIIDQILPEGGILMVFGQKSKGKTWVGLAMARAIGAGEKFMNHWQVKRARRTLSFDGEMYEPDLHGRVKSLMGNSPDAMKNCFFVTSEQAFKKLKHKLDITNSDDQQIILDKLEEMETLVAVPMFFSLTT